MRIYSPSLAQLDSLATLFDAYRIFYQKDSNLNGAKSFLRARMEQQESVIFVAEIEGALAGFTQLYPIFSSTNMASLWLLNDLYVVPESVEKQ